MSYPILCRESSLKNPALGVALPHFGDLDCRKLRVPAILAAWMTFLLVHISQIVGLGAEKQMLWPKACRSVAMVTYGQAGWDMAEMEFPRKPMREHATLSGSYRKEAVAAALQAQPKPASICFVNAGPETRNEFGFSIFPPARAATENDASIRCMGECHAAVPADSHLLDTLTVHDELLFRCAGDRAFTRRDPIFF